MTDHPCRACDAPAPDTVLCWDCAKRLHRLLHDLADDIVELTTQITRQTRTGSGSASRSAVIPLPFDPVASRVLDDVRTVLVGWTKVACEVEGDWPADTLAGMLRRLRRTRWASREAADELLDELAWTHRQVLDAIDTPPARRYLGPCGSVRIADDGTSHTCAGDVVVVGNRTPRCRDCRATHDVDERMQWITDIADSLLVTATDAAAVATAWGETVKAQAVYDWVRRGNLAPHGHDRNGHPVYVLAEVRALAADANRRAESRTHMPRPGARRAPGATEEPGKVHPNHTGVVTSL